MRGGETTATLGEASDDEFDPYVPAPTLVRRGCAAR